MSTKAKNKIVALITLFVLFLTFIPAKSISAESIKATPSISYSAHVQKIGWQPFVNDGELSGTMGRALRLEALKIKVNGDNLGVKYSVHVQNIGWQEYKKDGEIAGTTGKQLRIEAIKIELTGKNASIYIIKHIFKVKDGLVG